MRARLEPVAVPEKPGYLHVDLADKGRHHFRLPTWAQSSRISNFWLERPDGDSRWEYSALIVGAAWFHEALEIEAIYPLDNPSPANLLKFAEAVQRELEEEGYRAEDVRALGTKLLDALTARMKTRDAEIAEAKKNSDFSPPPPASTSAT